MLRRCAGPIAAQEAAGMRPWDHDFPDGSSLRQHAKKYRGRAQKFRDFGRNLYLTLLALDDRITMSRIVTSGITMPIFRSDPRFTMYNRALAP